MLQLPGYRVSPDPRLRNAVYIGNDVSFPVEGRKIKAMPVVLARQARMPSRREVMDYLTDMTRRVLGAKDSAELFRMKTGYDRPVIENIQALDHDQAESLARRGRGAAKILCDVLEHVPSGRHIAFKAGLVPVETHAMNESLGNISGDSWYDAAFKDEDFARVGLGTRWRLSLSYEGGELPGREIVDRLLEYPDSLPEQAFAISGVYTQEEVRAVLNSVYQADNEDLKNLLDVSDRVIREYALEVLSRMIEKRKEADLVLKETSKGHRVVWGVDSEGNLVM